MKKSTTTRFRVSNLLIIILAFLTGGLIYFAGAILYDKLTPAAAAAGQAWQQVTVQVGVCDCITIFRPQPSLSGAGLSTDPFITNNTRVDILVGVSGVGHITIADETGRVLAEFDQNFGDNPERTISIAFPNAGDQRLIIKLNGAEITANGVLSELYFRIGKLPSLIPDIKLPGVPNTGYIYIGGYAVQIYSLLISGILSATAAGFLLAAYRRRQHRNQTTMRVFIKKPTKKRGKKPRRSANAR
jgi:hypothetical protein